MSDHRIQLAVHTSDAVPAGDVEGWTLDELQAALADGRASAEVEAVWPVYPLTFTS